MNNYSQPGNVVTLVAPAGGVVSGSVYKIDQLVVVATATVAAASNFEGARIGVFTALPKDNGDAWAQGAPLYWDDGNSRFTTVSAAGLVLCATAAEAALLADTTGPVLLGVISNPDV